jgi:malate dehydrogenase (oxaloacetate-decarboxylating)
MKMAAARAIARIIPDSELREDYIIPSVFNRDVTPAVAEAVSAEAKERGTATAAGDTIGFAAVDAERMRAG